MAVRSENSGSFTPLPLREAWQRLVNHPLPRRVEMVPLERALHRVLAEEVVAREDAPRFTNSAMDGFAVRWEDVQVAAEGQTVWLQVVGESQAGHPYSREVQPGEAVRISTGAKMPPGADTVVPLEESHEENGRLKILRIKKAGQHVRQAGEEIRRGQTLFEPGTRLSPPRLGLLAAQGINRVTVFRRPRVAILVTGSELATPGQPLEEGQIRDSNSLMLASALRCSGGEVIRIDRLPDDLSQTLARLQEVEKVAELVLFSGGVSVGPHDHVKRAAHQAGYQTLFWRVNIKPGKPMFVAHKPGKLLFGLPGNPVSAYVCYSYFIHPVVRYLNGGSLQHPYLVARLAQEIHNPLERDHLMRVEIQLQEQDLPRAIPLPRQGSHMLTTVTRAGGFIAIPSGETWAEGKIVKVYLFPEGVDPWLP